MENFKAYLQLALLSFGFYLLSASLTAIFVAPIPMAEDWCVYGEDVQVGENEYEFKCYEFKNDYQHAVYRHNNKMLERNKMVQYSVIGLAIGLLLLLFYFIPKWKGKVFDEGQMTGAILGSVFGGILISVVGLWIFSVLLPPPVDWMPDILREINDAQINQAVSELSRLMPTETE